MFLNRNYKALHHQTHSATKCAEYTCSAVIRCVFVLTRLVPECVRYFFVNMVQVFGRVHWCCRWMHYRRIWSDLEGIHIGRPFNVRFVFVRHAVTLCILAMYMFPVRLCVPGPLYKMHSKCLQLICTICMATGVEQKGSNQEVTPSYHFRLRFSCKWQRREKTMNAHVKGGATLITGVSQRRL